MWRCDRAGSTSRVRRRTRSGISSRGGCATERSRAACGSPSWTSISSASTTRISATRARGATAVSGADDRPRRGRARRRRRPRSPGGIDAHRDRADDGLAAPDREEASLDRRAAGRRAAGARRRRARGGARHDARESCVEWREGQRFERRRGDVGRRPLRRVLVERDQPEPRRRRPGPTISIAATASRTRPSWSRARPARTERRGRAPATAGRRSRPMVTRSRSCPTRPT